MKITCAVAVLLLAGCSSAGPSVPLPSIDLPSSYRIVVYYVAGSATSADLTLNINGQQSQQNDIGLPIRNNAGGVGLHFTAAPGEFLYVSAQNKGGGTITCRITENGVTVASNESSGEFAIVTCDGTA